ncbi:MAG: transposase [Candidatus Promineofilum sp.]|nr:transposase [Promineifilum sp.]
MATLDAITGVIYLQRSHITTACLSISSPKSRPPIRRQRRMPLSWTTGRCIFTPDVLCRLQPQQLPGHRVCPAIGHRTATKAIRDTLPIQLLCLPTYASWLNPIEKLWRWLKQEVIRLHRCADDWPRLKSPGSHIPRPLSQRFVGVAALCWLVTVLNC